LNRAGIQHSGLDCAAVTGIEVVAAIILDCQCSRFPSRVSSVVQLAAGMPPLLARWEARRHECGRSSVAVAGIELVKFRHWQTSPFLLG